MFPDWNPRFGRSMISLGSLVRAHRRKGSFVLVLPGHGPTRSLGVK